MEKKVESVKNVENTKQCKKIPDVVSAGGGGGGGCWGRTRHPEVDPILIKQIKMAATVPYLVLILMEGCNKCYIKSVIFGEHSIQF